MLLLIPMKSMLFLLAWFNSSLHRLTDSQCWRANDRSKQCIVIISMSIYVHMTMTIHAIFWDKNQISDLTHYCIDSNDHCTDWNDHCIDSIDYYTDHTQGAYYLPLLILAVEMKPCEFHLVWRSLYACPICLENKNYELHTECVNGVKNITYDTGYNCRNRTGKVNPSHKFNVPCSVSSLL